MLINQKSPDLLLIVNSLLIGGHETQAKNILLDILSTGTNVLVLCSTEDLCAYFEETGAEVRCVPFNVKGKLLKQVASAKKTANLISPFVSFSCDVIVSGGSIEATINPVIAIRMINPKAHIVSYVPMYIDRSITHGWIGNLYNCILNVIARTTNEYLTVNRIQAYLIRRNTEVTTNYIRNRVRPVKLPTRNLGPRLVYLGRFDDKQKDVSGLIRLLDHPDNPYRNVVLVGDGPDSELILDASNRAKYIKIEIKGWLNSAQIDDQTGTQDVLIINSRWEGEPLVVREFLAKGLNCISRDIAGVRGVIGKKFRYNNQRELLSILNSVYKHTTQAALRNIDLHYG